MLEGDWCGTGKVLAYEFVTAQRQFGHKLLARLLNKEEPGNLIVSPTSLHWAFLMTREGADKDTLKGINTALSLPADRDNVSAVVRYQLDTLTKPVPGVTFTSAQGIWYKPPHYDTSKSGGGFPATIPLSAGFLDGVKPFAPKLDTLSGDAKKDAANINGFVSSKTNNMIPTIVEPSALPTTTAAVIANALYFKGDWTVAFDPKNDVSDRFCTTDISMSTYKKDCAPKRVSFMKQKAKFQVATSEKAYWIQLPYGKDKAFHMTLRLPKPGFTVKDALTEDLPSDKFSEQEVVLLVPAFDLDTSVPSDNMKLELSALGMGNAFDASQADFSRLFEKRGPDFYISDVFHKTKVTVSHQGTEAAAATAIVVLGKSVSLMPLELRFDRPFVMGIDHTETGTPLFLGVVSDPQPNAPAFATAAEKAGKTEAKAVKGKPGKKPAAKKPQKPRAAKKPQKRPPAKPRAKAA